MGNLVFGSGAEPGRASKARGKLTESPMERDYDATESERERYIMTLPLRRLDRERIVVRPHLIWSLGPYVAPAQNVEVENTVKFEIFRPSKAKQ